MSNQHTTSGVTNKLKTSSSCVKCVYGVYVLPIRYSSGNHSITCWLPLKETEPKNKKDPQGLLGLRKKQPGRGNYYQMNGGESVHVYMYEKSVGSLVKHSSKWNYHVSHRCHHWWCCNPAHLIYEPEWVNQLRKGCKFDSLNCNCDKANHPDLIEGLLSCIWFPSSVDKETVYDDSGVADKTLVELIKDICT